MIELSKSQILEVEERGDACSIAEILERGTLNDGTHPYRFIHGKELPEKHQQRLAGRLLRTFQGRLMAQEIAQCAGAIGVAALAGISLLQKGMHPVFSAAAAIGVMCNALAIMKIADAFGFMRKRPEQALDRCIESRSTCASWLVSRVSSKEERECSLGLDTRFAESFRLVVMAAGALWLAFTYPTQIWDANPAFVSIFLGGGIFLISFIAPILERMRYSEKTYGKLERRTLQEAAQKAKRENERAKEQELHKRFRVCTAEESFLKVRVVQNSGCEDEPALPEPDAAESMKTTGFR